MELLRQAWERILNESYPAAHENKAVRYIDAAMAVHNFHRMTIMHVVSDCGMPDVEALGFMRLMQDTFVEGVDRDMAQLHDRVESLEERRRG